MKITHLCPAKVNLFLEVTGKRPNGYHELLTLFAKINLTDTLTVSAEPAAQTTLSLTLTGPVGKQLRADETNLVCRAARGFLEHFGLTARVEMTLDKHIPTGAGLGGGSSDAAHTLLALCEIFNKNKQELAPLAAKLGADVPLFMLEDTLLKGEGIGEKLTPVPASGELPWLVLAYPNTPVSTKEVFARLQLPEQPSILKNQVKLDKLLSCLFRGNPLADWQNLLFNRLEEYVVPFTNTVEDTLRNFKDTSAGPVLMSGSGSTVFALAENEQEAKTLENQMRREGRTVFCTTFYQHANKAA